MYPSSYSPRLCDELRDNKWKQQAGKLIKTLITPPTDNSYICVCTVYFFSILPACPGGWGKGQYDYDEYYSTAKHQALYNNSKASWSFFTYAYCCYQTSHNHRSVAPWRIVNKATWATAGSFYQRTVSVFQTVEKNMRDQKIKDQNWDHRFWLN